jgi:hypothetical protein
LVEPPDLNADAPFFPKQLVRMQGRNQPIPVE